jgi:hypothetical protein
MASSILDLLKVSQALTLEFLATFARFEFALKKAGYVRGDEVQVSPDWDAFARDLATVDAVLIGPVLDSCKYLQEHPPRKQVLQARRLQWVDRKGNSGSPIGDVLLSVRTVRNNVFHGGKFPDGPVAEPLRDEALIRDCVSILKGLLKLPLPKDVAKIYMEGI